MMIMLMAVLTACSGQKKEATAPVATTTETLAPDFTLTSIDGTQLSLKSLRGKFVVIDFWGSWCPWCIKGFPALKAYYEQHSDRLEVLGVDCNDTEEQWRAAVKEHSLPWKQVRMEKGQEDVLRAYGVRGFPTKVIVSPEGKLLNTTVGEDPEFFVVLDQLMN